MQNEMKFEELMAKVKKMREEGDVDLSLEEDLSIAIMNLISLEEHFFFTGEKTGKPQYFDLLNEIRMMRKELLGRIVMHHEGETWCITKHLLATTMRLMEVGSRYQAEGKKDEAKKLFDMAYKTYSFFWAIRLKLVATSDLKKKDDILSGKTGAWTVEDIVSKLVDCCNE
ncbi:MAG: hypothetical protein A3H06_01415 [Candidatus Colwellbacteria bacterium RIFCSPLOWO2_12_FULL_44_13]|uniref:Uncharacterized protein n=2 Tax=Candidatus Colwelliibacteriota TaxID=1817904 RepID=A0A1G1Z745_9BACT|nr:MAG: hypothetical protein A3I31_01070 [Candidatus Colwellbacteria bacterium RIFCSPLOWO2_02_FULL_44_20b]OGY61333.1 MAG: hypothetical protein A3H06_01415 [Candidatus Colwellbacteria bacterium RIFCSPLOWO2_12_FULL_44_13]